MTVENAHLITEKDVEDYELLTDLLYSQRAEFDLLSKKKPDGQLNPMKIMMVNRVLEPLKELFKQEQSHEYLDTLNEDEMPTYSDVVLIISQYKTALDTYRRKYYREVWGEKRWDTQEFREYMEEEIEKEERAEEESLDI